MKNILIFLLLFTFSYSGTIPSCGGYWWITKTTTSTATWRYEVSPPPEDSIINLSGDEYISVTYVESYVTGSSSDTYGRVYHYDSMNEYWLCSPNPTCLSPKVLDFSVTPPACVDDTPECDTETQVLKDNICQSCPVNSAPNADNTFCDCVSPAVLTDVNGTYMCIVPPEFLDSDNDGVNDAEDAFPNDPNETKDNDGDGIGNNADTDDDNDGYSDAQEEKENTSPISSSSNSGVNPDGGGSNSGATPNTSSETPCTPTNTQIKMYDGSCEECNPGTSPDYSQTTCIPSNSFCPVNITTCDRNCECPAGTTLFRTPFTDSNEITHMTICSDSSTGMKYEGIYCEDFSSASEPDINNCEHATFLSSYPFQFFTNTSKACENSQLSANSLGLTLPLQNCSQGKYACYFKKGSNIFDNNGSSSPMDSNISDSNPDDNIDDSAIVSKLEDIKKINQTTNSKLDSINNSITTQTSALSSKLDVISGTLVQTGNNIKDAVNNASNSNTQSIKNQSAYLGSKLDGIKGAIESQDISGTDMAQTNALLEEIKEGQNPEIEFDNSGLENSFTAAQQAFENTLVSFNTSYNDMVSLFSGARSPTVTASGDCTLNVGQLSFGSTSFDFSFLSNLRPAFQFFLNLILFYFTIKLYVTIARDLAKYFIGA